MITSKATNKSKEKTKMATVGPKKIKGQIPYSDYVWLKKMADNRRVKMSEIILGMVQDAVESPVKVYERKLIHWAEDARSNSPNNVHFIADRRLEERFEYFKIMNHLTVDSVAIRAIIRDVHEKKENPGAVNEEQAVFF